MVVSCPCRRAYRPHRGHDVSLGRLALHELNLTMRLFHTDCHAHLLLPIQGQYGSRIRLQTFTEEHLFTLESMDKTLSLDEVVAKFGRIDIDTYIQRSECNQDSARAAHSKA